MFMKEYVSLENTIRMKVNQFQDKGIIIYKEATKNNYYIVATESLFNNELFINELWELESEIIERFENYNLYISKENEIKVDGLNKVSFVFDLGIYKQISYLTDKDINSNAILFTSLDSSLRSE